MKAPTTLPSPPPCNTDTLINTLRHDNTTLARETLAAIAERLLDLSQAAKALCDGDVLLIPPCVAERVHVGVPRRHPSEQA